MNSSITASSSPTSPATWREGWTFVPPAESLARAATASGLVLQAGAPGVLFPEGSSPAWRLRLPWDASALSDGGAGIWTAHGACNGTPGSDQAVEFVCPAVGFVVGETRHDAPPVLESDRNIERRPTLDILELERNRAVLLVKQVVRGRMRFCLCAADGTREDILAQAHGFLDTGASRLGERVAAGRKRWLAELPEDADGPALAHDLLASRLRTHPGGRGLIFASPGAPDRARGIDLFPVVRAWCRIDPGIAWNLLQTYLWIGSGTDTLPAWVPIGPAAGSTSEPMPPILIRTLLSCWRAMPDRGALLACLDDLAPYLNALFPSDADAASHGTWQVPDGIRPPGADPASPDRDLARTALRLGEGLALLDLRREAGIQEFLKRYPVEARVASWQGQVSGLWNEDRRLFDDRAAATAEDRPGFYQGLTLLDSRMPRERRDAVARLFSPQMLMTADRLAAWVPRDDEQPPAPPPWLVVLLLTGLIRNQDRTLCTSLTPRLAAQANAAIDPTEPEALGWCAVALEAALFDHPLSRHYTQAGRWAVWIDQHRLAVVGTAFGLAVVLVGLLTLLLTTRHALTDGQLETVHALGVQYYRDGNYEEAMKIFTDLQDRGQGISTRTDWWIGNILFQQGQYEDALKAFETGMQPPYTPHAETMMNRALALYQLQRFDEAAEAYRETADTFERSLPTLARRARIAEDLARKRSRIGGDGGNP